MAADVDPDLHEAKDGRGLRAVFLDGQEVQDVTQAHTRDGWLIRSLRDENGAFYCGADGEIASERLQGVVTVRFNTE